MALNRVYQGDKVNVKGRFVEVAYTFSRAGGSPRAALVNGDEISGYQETAIVQKYIGTDAESGVPVFQA